MKCYSIHTKRRGGEMFFLGPCTLSSLPRYFVAIFGLHYQYIIARSNANCVSHSFFLSLILYNDIHSGSLTLSRPSLVMSSPPPTQPSLPWRASSSFVMGVTGALSRAFLYGLSNTETVGLERFLEILERRKDVAGRERGLLTGNCPRGS
jgi:hypothetical protein